MMNNRFERHSKSTQRAAFLARLETLMPWAGFWALIEPHAPMAGNRHHPFQVESMLRMYFIANGFNVHDSQQLGTLTHGQEPYPLTEADHLATPRKPCVRAQIQHPFLRIKHLWELPKVRYRSLAKNTCRAFAMLALHNIVHWEKPFAGEVHMA